MNERLEKIRYLLGELEDDMEAGAHLAEIAISPLWSCH
jgi:hypothetical protein